MTKLEAEIKNLKSMVKINSAVEKARTQLRSEILKGFVSGPGMVVNNAYWDKLRALARRHAPRT